MNEPIISDQRLIVEYPTTFDGRQKGKHSEER
jgi:hypothetical protein